MNRIYKKIIFFGALAVMVSIANFAFAGKGYFLEKNNSFYILDNLYISGYLSVEEIMSDQKGLPGDVLVEKRLFLDEDNIVYFCKDERTPNTNAPRNKDCANKLLIWEPDSLMVVGDKNRLVASKLTVNTNNFINLDVPDNKAIYTRDSVVVDGCFSNLNLCQGGFLNGQACDIGDPAACPGSGVCQPCDYNGDFRTSDLYYEDLLPLSGELLTIGGKRLVFRDINLGDETNVNNNHYICWLIPDTVASCPLGAAIGERNSKWDIPLSAGTKTGLWGTSSNVKLCCFLQFTF